MTTLGMNQNETEQSAWMQTYTILAGLLIVLLLITAGAGLLSPAIYVGFAPPKYVQESRGQDLITLVLGIPLLLLAVMGIRRSRAWAFPLWTGVLAYELYVYGIYAIGGVYNVYFLGYIAVAALSIYTMIGLLGSVDVAWFGQAMGAKLPRRWIGGFFGVITAVFATIWIGQVMTTINTGIVDSGHLIFVFDLMIVLPAFGITAVKQFRKQAFGDVLAGMLLIKFDSLCISLTVGQLFRYLNGINVETELLGVFIPLGIIGLIFTAIYFKQFSAQ